MPTTSQILPAKNEKSNVMTELRELPVIGGAACPDRVVRP